LRIQAKVLETIISPFKQKPVFEPHLIIPKRFFPCCFSTKNVPLMLGNMFLGFPKLPLLLVETPFNTNILRVETPLGFPPLVIPSHQYQTLPINHGFFGWDEAYHRMGMLKKLGRWD